MPKSPFLQKRPSVTAPRQGFWAVRYAFGSGLRGRTASFGVTYKYGFNNQEKEGELGEYYSFEYRVHDARLGRFLSVDPWSNKYYFQSVFVFGHNNPILNIDFKGLGDPEVGDIQQIGNNYFVYNGECWDILHPSEVEALKKRVEAIKQHMQKNLNDPTVVFEGETETNVTNCSYFNCSRENWIKGQKANILEVVNSSVKRSLRLLEKEYNARMKIEEELRKQKEEEERKIQSISTVNIVKKSQFEKYQMLIFQWEGGYVDDPDDMGGATNMGITFGTFKQYAQSDLGVEPTLDNLKHLTRAQAAIIYKRNYWDFVKGDQIHNGSLAYMLFDFTVGSGTNSISVLQRTLNTMGQSVKITYRMDAQTLDAVNAVNSQELFNAYKTARLNFIDAIIRNRPSQVKYEKGWKRRINSIKYEED